MLPAQDKDNNKMLKDLEKKVQALESSLKSRWDMHEKAIEDLKSQFETNGNRLETHRQQIIRLQSANGTLDTGYGGKEYDLQ